MRDGGGNLKQKRIVFIDLIRALATLMMVQGHTVDVLLSNEYRDDSNLGFSFWVFMRGLTAPIFLFTTGAIFIYLFRSNPEHFHSNPRVRKGVKRALQLVALGYLLRYPSASIIHLSSLPAESWRTFFAVDVLQLIGFSMLFILGTAFLSEKFKLNDYLLFSCGGLFFFACYPFSERIEWIDSLPGLIAGYLYFGSGSNFPLFPWAGYVICGGVLGSYLANHRSTFSSFGFSLILAALGLLLLALYQVAQSAEAMLNPDGRLASSPPSLIFQRLGLVLILYSVVSRIAVLLDTIPDVILSIGQNTLPIYVGHLVILYGSAWNSGLDKFYGKSLTAWQAFVAVLVMITAMTGAVVLYERIELQKYLFSQRPKAS